MSENAEYHAAKERQGQIEAMIADIDDRLSRALVIDPTDLSGDKVVFGATVTLIDEDEKTIVYQLVGQTEADAKEEREGSDPIGDVDRQQVLHQPRQHLLDDHAETGSHDAA